MRTLTIETIDEYLRNGKIQGLFYVKEGYCYGIVEGVPMIIAIKEPVE